MSLYAPHTFSRLPTTENDIYDIHREFPISLSSLHWERLTLVELHLERVGLTPASFARCIYSDSVSRSHRQISSKEWTTKKDTCSFCFWFRRLDFDLVSFMGRRPFLLFLFHHWRPLFNLCLLFSGRQL
jgi:hypothetical protein